MTDNPVNRVVFIGRFLSWSRYDKRRTSFINQYAVYFINNGKIEIPLNKLIHRVLHVVSKVIKTEFVIGAISNIRHVSLLTLGLRHVMINITNAQA